MITLTALRYAKDEDGNTAVSKALDNNHVLVSGRTTNMCRDYLQRYEFVFSMIVSNVWIV